MYTLIHVGMYTRVVWGYTGFLIFNNIFHHPNSTTLGLIARSFCCFDLPEILNE